MEHINIIAQEEITAPLEWVVWLVGVLTIVAIFGLTFYSHANPQNAYRIVIPILYFGCGGILGVLITSLFLRVPTGRYKYEATIDKDNITVAEYEQFIEEYNPTIKDGIYYWEDKAE